jgi:hypothetical protein
LQFTEKRYSFVQKLRKIQFGVLVKCIFLILSILGIKCGILEKVVFIDFWWEIFLWKNFIFWGAGGEILEANSLLPNVWFLQAFEVRTKYNYSYSLSTIIVVFSTKN